MDYAPRPAWSVRLETERERRRWNKHEMARRLLAAAGTEYPPVKSLAHQVRRWERGEHFPRDWTSAYAAALDMTEEEVFGSAAPPTFEGAAGVEDEIEALDLARRVAASDVGDETLRRLEQVVDGLAIAYPRTMPGDLLGPIRRHLAYVAGLLDARKTLAEHRRLLTIGGWLSLLGATCHIDLFQRAAAEARLLTAAGLAKEAEHPEIAAWCLETRAWRALTDGHFRDAVELSRGAQTLAPRGGSAHIQATAQEGRLWARLGAPRETYEQLDQVAALTANLPVPERPEHHYRYDPAKADAYIATTLAWLGDPAAEPQTRQVLAEMETPADGRVRERRVASSRLDLSLALVAADRPDEAAHEALTAITSGVLVPSNYWRAAEVIAAVEAADVPEAVELREAYRELCRGHEAAHP